MKYHLTLVSSNAKTGPIPVSTSGNQTCPDACPLKAGGCYASAGGPLALHWRKVSEGARGDDYAQFLDRIKALPEGQLWRHNQAGDLPGEGDKIDASALSKLVAANRGKRGFTYTHKPMSGASARKAVKAANAGGFTINLSGDNLSEADELAALKIAPVVVVLPSDAPAKLETPNGRKVIVCPAQQKEGITCATCQLCSRSTRSVIIGFLAHGSQAKKASAVANG